MAGYVGSYPDKAHHTSPVYWDVADGIYNTPSKGSLTRNKLWRRNTARFIKETYGTYRRKCQRSTYSSRHAPLPLRNPNCRYQGSGWRPCPNGTCLNRKFDHTRMVRLHKPAAPWPYGEGSKDQSRICGHTDRVQLPRAGHPLWVMGRGRVGQQALPLLMSQTRAPHTVVC